MVVDFGVPASRNNISHDYRQTSTRTTVPVVLSDFQYLLRTIQKSCAMWSRQRLSPFLSKTSPHG